MESAGQEDVSARVLLRNVLQTETQRSPVTRSLSRYQRLSRVRRSSRLGNAPETPHVALRNKLKQKLHESAAQSPLPPSKRARPLDGTLSTPAVLSSPMLYGDDITPRGLLRGIIRSEAEASLLLSGQTPRPHGDQQDRQESIHSNRRSDGVSGLELPDLATEPLTHVIRGMSRRRPPPTFNVSVFEKQLEQPPGEEEEMNVSPKNPDVSEEQDVSAGSQSVLSLTLKTPFVSLPSERAGLKRKAAGRRKQLSVDAFDEAVQKRLARHHDQDDTVVQDGRTLQDSAWQKFTLGLSNVTVPELTTDLILSNTELYTHPQVSESKLRDTEGRKAEAESKRDDCDGVGEELQDIFQDQPNMCESDSSKPQPDPSEHPEPGSSSQAEEDEEDIIPLSQGDESLSPEEMPFAPARAMVVRVAQEAESVIPEDQLEEMDQRECPSLQDEEPSSLPQRITKRAFRSEGGAIRNGSMAGSRGTKSLGMREDLAEKREESSEALQGLAPGSELEDLAIVEEESHRSPASSSATHTTKPSPSEMHQDRSVQNPDEEGVLQHGQLESERLMVSFWVCTTAEEEEAKHQDVVEEEQHQDVVEEEQHQDVVEEEQHQDVVEEEQHQDVVEEEQHRDVVEEEQHRDVVEEEQHRDVVEEEQHRDVEEEEQHRDVEEEEQHRDVEEEEQEMQQEEEEDAQSEELSMETPGFIRQRKQVSTPGALATPTILKAVNAGPAPKVKKPRPKRRPRSASSGVLSKSYVMSVFKHFAKTKVATDVYPAISDILQRYFDRLADDLEVYSAHAKRKTIEVEDVELLMRRQGFVTDGTPVNVLIEKFLPLEYRKLLIPIATSGNKVVPDQKR